jgi:hypothetical protein
MPATYEPIATTTVAVAAAAITFSSIAATYTDLKLVVSGGTTLGGYAYLQFNSDTGSNYSTTRLDADGNGTVDSTRTSAATFIRTSSALTTAANLTNIDIFSYSGSTFKTCLSNTAADDNGSGRVTPVVGLWRSTSAITSVTFTSTNTFSIGTTATLYGIKNA